jgi:hypothetical protein
VIALRVPGGVLNRLKMNSTMALLALFVVTIVGQENPGGISPDLYSPDMRNNADLDGFFYRISTRYHLSVPASFYVQPMNVGHARAFLRTVDSLDRENKLSPQETIDLQRIKRIVDSKNSLFSYADAQHARSLHVGISLIDSSHFMVRDSSAVFTRGTITPRLSGNVGRFSFYSSVDVWTDYRSDTLWHTSTYEPYDGVPYNLYGRKDSANTRASDLPRGGIRYDGGVYAIEAAIDYLKQGPAVFTPLTFSGNAPPITFVRGTLDLGIAEYVQTVGQLKSDKDKPKYLYTHRLNIPLFHSLVNAGITEVVINGSTTNEPHTATDSANALRKDYYNQTRGWEPVYMIPFVPYVFVEHYAGDRDNKALSFDATLNWPDKTRFYGEFFIDDMTAPWSLFSSDWGNKWAFTIGGQYFGAIMNKDISATAEYTRVEPWVYTHFYGGAERYDNFNQCLGAPLGPDFDMLTLLCETAVAPLHSVGLQFSTTRKNSVARGGAVADVFQDTTHNGFSADSWTKHFLGPGTVTTTQLRVYWKFNQFGIFRVTSKYTYDFSGASIFELFGGVVF